MRIINITMLLAAVLTLASCGNIKKKIARLLEDDDNTQTEQIDNNDLADILDDADGDSNTANTATPTSSTNDEAQLKELTKQFYANSFKAKPVLKMLTPEFENTMRRCQSKAGYDGVKGYISFILWNAWGDGGTEYDIASYDANVTKVYIDSDGDEAEVKVSLAMKYREIGNSNFTDLVEFERVNGKWMIDDIERDGTSLKKYFYQNPLVMP